MRGERAGEQQRAGAEPQPDERCREGVAERARLAGIHDRREPEQQLQAIRERQRDGDHEQPPAGLQEIEAAVREVDPERSAGGERAGEQRRQERAQPAGGREAGAEADVEEMPFMQSAFGGALPCGNA